MALYTGCPNQFIPDQIKNQRLQPFLPPQGQELIQTHPRGEEDKLSKQETKETQSGLRAPFPRKGNQQAQKIKKILELLNL